MHHEKHSRCKVCGAEFKDGETLETHNMEAHPETHTHHEEHHKEPEHEHAH